MSYQLKTTIKIAAVAIAAALSSTAFAQSAGDNVVNVGWYHIAPNDSSTPLTITSPAPVATTLAGSGASVEKADTVGFSLTHFFTNNWAGSLDLGIPPTYKIKGTGTLAAVGEIGEAKQWAPTVLGKYFFCDSTAAFRPFLGLGASRVSYKDIKLNSTFQGAVDGTLLQMSQGAVVGGSTTAALDSSWAPVYNVGASYAINKDWYASFSVSYLGLKTSATLTTASNIGPITSTTSIKIDPIVTFAAIGYRF
jgi:outer membrane protein